MVIEKNNIHWKTEKRKINDLIPFEGNPRKMTGKQARDLRTSLERFNLVEIPAINTDNKIISGHQRLKILQMLGRGDETIDVRVPNRELTDKEFREYNLRSNKNVGSWDNDLLKNLDLDMLIDVGFSENLLKLPSDLDKSLGGDEGEQGIAKRISILLSFNSELLAEVEPYIEKILELGDVEIDRSES